MRHLKIQNQLSRINGAYQQCMDELQAHGIDTNSLVLLQIERHALVDLLLDEIRSLSARIDTLRKTEVALEPARQKERHYHVS